MRAVAILRHVAVAGGSLALAAGCSGGARPPLTPSAAEATEPVGGVSVPADRCDAIVEEQMASLRLAIEAAIRTGSTLGDALVGLVDDDASSECGPSDWANDAWRAELERLYIEVASRDDAQEHHMLLNELATALMLLASESTPEAS